MAGRPQKKPDRHFEFSRLNLWFGVSALALLAVTGWMVMADYSKPWKRLQSDFRDRERQALLRQADVERQQVDENELLQLQQEISQEEERLDASRTEIRELESTLDEVEKKIYATDSASRTTKSLLDAARWKYDRTVQESDLAAKERARQKVDDLDAQWLEDRKALELLTEQRDQARGSLDQREAALEEAERRLAALRQGFDTLEQRAANLDKTLSYRLLNAPLLDFMNPDLKIEQVMLPGLYHDINFTKVERVDRCVTCHVAANRIGFDGEEWEHPFRSHPRMDLFVGAGSPHPYNRFGCSGCHGGLDRSTDFARVGHSPSSNEELASWQQNWDWEPQPYLETPIFPAEFSEAGCFTCHSAEVWTPGAEVQDTGRQLAMRMGCFVCHKIDYPAFQDLPRPGPNLSRVAGKTNPGWAFEWISAPRDFRPTTWMPHFFFQENTTTELNLERQKVEIASVVAYLWEKSESPEYLPPPPGDPRQGQVLFESVGCTGCHLMDAEARRDDFFPQINRLHGPNLVRTGSKVSPGWLYSWIRNPRQYAPDTRMPVLRLTDKEAADITAYLMSSRDPAFEELELPEADQQVRDQMVLQYLRNNQTIEQSLATLQAMTTGERDVYLGFETIQKYGCWGCHDLAGFEIAKPIGVELTEEGSKPLHQFDFGHVHDVPHTRHDWIRKKLLDPRTWDEGKEAVKHYDELLKMPNFGMSEREADAVLTMVLGFTRESVEASSRAGQTTRSISLVEGRRLITRFNCQGCHLIEGDGHAIKTAIEDVGMLPPNLAAQGARVKSDWLFEYLHDPGAVRLRPWLEVRMPTFGFSDDEVNALVSYFAAREERLAFLSDPPQPETRELVVGDVAFNMFQCAKCHPAGPQEDLGAGVGAGDLAPSLLLAKRRLRHDWVPHWILDPQSWIPGTKMPANFPPNPEGGYTSPLAMAIDTPMFEQQKERMMRHFSSDEELKSHLGDADYVTQALRDHIWWNLEQ
ncbi:MAG: c-type cytochrome [Thermoanaerobaculia bacterium]|jgi:cytochrome c2